MAQNKFRPFGDKSYDYYRLKQSLGYNNSGYGIKKYILPSGSIFVHDKYDTINGSPAEGCLTLCWTKDGNTYGNICGECQHFHASFRNTDLFEKVVDDTRKTKLEEIVSKLRDQLREAENELSNI